MTRLPCRQDILVQYIRSFQLLLKMRHMKRVVAFLSVGVSCYALYRGRMIHVTLNPPDGTHAIRNITNYSTLKSVTHNRYVNAMLGARIDGSQLSRIKLHNKMAAYTTRPASMGQLNVHLKHGRQGPRGMLSMCSKRGQNWSRVPSRHLGAGGKDKTSVSLCCSPKRLNTSRT